jgi:hypothetical protein
MGDAAAGDDRGDAAGGKCPPVGEVIVAAVGQQVAGLASGSAAAAADRWDCVHQGKELGDIVPVGTGEDGGERDSSLVDDQVVF